MISPPVLLRHVVWNPQPMISPVECKEHIGGKSHLVLKYQLPEMEKVIKIAEIHFWPKKLAPKKRKFRQIRLRDKTP